MKKIFQEHGTLLIALLIPILMILFIAGSIYLPALFSDKTPEYDFLFATGSLVEFDAEGRTEYFVEGETLQKEEIPLSDERNDFFPRAGENPRFYRYDVSEQEAASLDYESAREFVLDQDRTSPDGFVITESNSPFFLDFGARPDERFLKNGGYTEALELPQTSRGYYDFQFLGWIIR